MSDDTLQRIFAGEVIIVDDFSLPFSGTDFLERPLRKQGLSNFPGRFRILDSTELREFERAIEETLSVKLLPESGVARIRRTGKGDRGQAFIHHDEAQFVCTVYLSDLPPEVEPEDFGTSFYRHRRTGWTQFPQRKTLQLASNLILRSDGHDLAAWDVVEKVPFRKYRALFYLGRLYHSPPACVLDGRCGHERLTLEFFGALAGLSGGDPT